MNRRNFLTRASAATVGALGALAVPTWLNAAAPKEKTRIRIIYSLHGEQQAGPDWPNKGFDFRPVMDRINQTLADKCKEFEFVTSLATGEEQAKKLVEQDKVAGNVDGYLVYQMNCWNRVVQTVAASGKPVLYADFQYGGSGGFLVYNAAFLRSQAPNVGFVASSKIKRFGGGGEMLPGGEAGRGGLRVCRGYRPAAAAQHTARRPVGRPCRPGQMPCPR
jgi:hypothetical protein